MNKMTVYKCYQDVIEDVMNGVRDLFAEDGVDDQILQELRQTWMTKLMASKAVTNQAEIEKEAKLNEVVKQPQNMVKQVVRQVYPTNAGQPQQVVQVLETKMVPIQIKLPAQPQTGNPARVLTIQVPASALQGNQLQKILTGPVITTTMGLPENIASSFLQQHVNATLSQAGALTGTVNNTVIQNDGCADSDGEAASLDAPGPSCSKPITFKVKKPKVKKRPQIVFVDGPVDTSDEEEEVSEEEDMSDDLDDDKDPDETEIEAEGFEEEPLNSEDDVTDDDSSDLFDTENVVVCQFDKITKNRNKWKFYLKDGIMNLNSEDYLFQKANGDAEW